MLPAAAGSARRRTAAQGVGRFLLSSSTPAAIQTGGAVMQIEVYAATQHAQRARHSHLCDLPALVVAAQDGYSLRVPHLERHQQRHRLHCSNKAMAKMGKT